MKAMIAGAALCTVSLGAWAEALPSSNFSLLPSEWSTATSINFNRIDPVSVPGGVGVFVPADSASEFGLVFELPAVPDTFSGWWVDGVVSTSVFNSFNWLGMHLGACADLSCATVLPTTGASFSQASDPNLWEFRFDGGLMQAGRYRWSFEVENLQSTTFTMTPQIDAVAAVPEPSTLALMLMGLGVVAAATRRQRPRG